MDKQYSVRSLIFSCLVGVLIGLSITVLVYETKDSKKSMSLFSCVMKENSDLVTFHRDLVEAEKLYLDIMFDCRMEEMRRSDEAKNLAKTIKKIASCSGSSEQASELYDSLKCTFSSDEAKRMLSLTPASTSMDIVNRSRNFRQMLSRCFKKINLSTWISNLTTCAIETDIVTEVGEVYANYNMSSNLKTIIETYLGLNDMILRDNKHYCRKFANDIYVFSRLE